MIMFINQKNKNLKAISSNTMISTKNQLLNKINNLINSKPIWKKRINFRLIKLTHNFTTKQCKLITQISKMMQNTKNGNKAYWKMNHNNILKLLSHQKNQLLQFNKTSKAFNQIKLSTHFNLNLPWNSLL